MEKIKFTTIDDYIALQREQIQPTLELLRQTIRDAAPEAEELISYSMPAFKYKGALVWFHTYKNHYAVYMRPHILDAFRSRLSEYVVSKSAVQFPINELFPIELVTEMVLFAVECNEQNLGIKVLRNK